MQVVIPLAIWLLAATVMGQSIKHDDIGYSVCEVLSHRIRLDGRLILVRGIVKSGGHGIWLAADGECRHELLTKGVRWPNEIYLAYPNNQSKDETVHAPFSVDWRSVAKSEEVTKRAGYRDDRDDIVITYEGLFVTYRDLARRVSPNVPGALKLGFGTQGAFPAQLLIRRIVKTVVVHK